MSNRGRPRKSGTREVTKVCKYCDAEFTPRRQDQVFCSVDCRYAANKMRKHTPAVRRMDVDTAKRNAWVMGRYDEPLAELIMAVFGSELAEPEKVVARMEGT